MKHWHGVRLALLILLVSSGLATAQSFPTSLVRIIVPFQAGSGTDTLARILAEELGGAGRSP